MLIYSGKRMDGEVPLPLFSENVRLVRGQKKQKRMVAPEWIFRNRSREVRVCPLQQLKCPKGTSGGTADIFALRFLPQGVFIDK